MNHYTLIYYKKLNINKIYIIYPQYYKKHFILKKNMICYFIKTKNNL